MTRSTRGRAVLLACILFLTLAAAPGQANATETKWQIGSALASVVYAPAKVAYAAVGVVFGGIAWGLAGGDEGVMHAVIDPAIHGDYLVTPAHLRGERSIAFVGSSPAATPPEPAAAEYGDFDAPLDDPYARAYDEGY